MWTATNQYRDISSIAIFFTIFIVDEILSIAHHYCVQLTMCIFYTIVFLELTEQQRVCYEKLKAVKS